MIVVEFFVIRDIVNLINFFEFFELIEMPFVLTTCYLIEDGLKVIMKGKVRYGGVTASSERVVELLKGSRAS